MSNTEADFRVFFLDEDLQQDLDTEPDIDRPLYMKAILEGRKRAQNHFKEFGFKVDQITDLGLGKLYKFEKKLLGTNDSLESPALSNEFMSSIDCMIKTSRKIYHKTWQRRYCDVLVGLLQLKEVSMEIQEMKKAEYNEMKEKCEHQ